MDNEMIERVSRAILETPNASDYKRLVAVNVIKAMREPTEKMKTLVTDDIVITDKCYYCGGHIQGWQAMIDSVIND